MTLRLRPPPTVPKDIRDFTKWCREALLEGIVGTDNLTNGSVTFEKIQDIATDRILGRATAGTGDVEQITCTAAGRALLDDASATVQRMTLGLGNAATQGVGTSGNNLGLLNTANTHTSAQCTAFSVGSATPATTQSANADTSGATLGQLETELNEIKQVLRTFGLIAT